MKSSRAEVVSFRRLLRFYLFGLIVALALILLILSSIYFWGSEATWNNTKQLIQSLNSSIFFLSLLVGFIAQIIDGTLGMAYGVSSNTFLLSMGISPATASASIHFAEIFTTGASGLSHWQFGNIDKKLFLKLIFPGIVGAIIGAYILSSFDGKNAIPFISIYLMIMGVVIILKSFKMFFFKKTLKGVIPLAFLGGLFDASGGGGWGPIVTTTLIGMGNRPRKTIGSVNAAEFFIAFVASGTFTIMIGLSNWPIILGLILGGMIASPMAAFLIHKIPPYKAMLIVGILIILLSLRNIIVYLQ
ncbi:MAG: sulfite exporter TauE/SafE family protein [Bacteroidales bacterium]|nr:sulfite exporter TauE/SafE family protein [Bacteroidales bacterium]